MRNLLVTLLATSSVLSYSAAAGGMSLAEKDKALDSYVESQSLKDTDVINDFNLAVGDPFLTIM
ncbi:hypothetical protein [Pseudoalteromonas pernae]|uniref:hypothetical protein n=1 Tax=Pseudoalteromonas pernae TaxID=3118054 RepID=UPI003242D3E2